MLMPLEMLSSGDIADVADISGDPAWVNRLAELGLRQGCRLQVLQSGSTCLLNVAGCKLCLRSDQSANILVRAIGA